MKNLAFKPTIIDRLTVHHFRSSLPRQGRSAFDREFALILHNERPFLTDKLTQSHIIFVAAFLSAYRTLRSMGLGNDASKEKLTPALFRLGRRTAAFFTWAGIAMSRNPMQALRRFSETKAQNAYGPSFAVETAAIPGGFVSEVKRCGYRTFLARHDAVDLNSLLCEWDRVWIDALPKSIDFRRPTTLATGCASCRFEFRYAERSLSGKGPRPISDTATREKPDRRIADD
ncbi:hypothetical protein GCM10011499_36870 [Pelagibacterium lentulum]|uniref:L-2-amino-thiazoline-4-carboxylic acid hydrolase n=2 Tax=Pelagibacterium lentulum TaxID=2029865 RepID=A0A916RNZ1_9HYPH|nr:L-2-amino-thiazoline-4-carboxylic acid hydrolase [Pelagibacterium lentulum]GGA63107.1 hypothetical protein GCM10011499_36870 [Pelagibacterium lentulum]